MRRRGNGSANSYLIKLPSCNAFEASLFSSIFGRAADVSDCAHCFRRRAGLPSHEKYAFLFSNPSSVISLMKVLEKSVLFYREMVTRPFIKLHAKTMRKIRWLSVFQERFHRL